MNATIGLLAYGLRPSPLAEGAPAWLLAAGAYGSMSWDLQMQAAHAGCHVSAFCRNPLHPGPCKGWKHHLGLVSPGALHALEKIRHEKLEENRKSKVKALQDAGHAVPKKLLTPIVYDPAKNKHLQQPDKITPGLGIPTKGLTPEAAKATLDKIPTKAQVGAKLEAKHAAEAAAAVPKPEHAPQYLTISKAGLKPGDKVFLHGKGKTAGEGQLVTVRKIAGNGKAQGYEFEGADGKMLPHAGGPSAKWHLSPAPGESFPDTPAQKVAANMAGFEKGEQTKMDNLHKLGEAQKKANGQTDAFTKMLALTNGKHPTEAQKSALHAKFTGNNQADQPKNVLPEGATAMSAKKITAKLWQQTHVDDHAHQADVEAALLKDINDGIEHGHPTPVLDAAHEALKTLGLDVPGSDKALADAVHAKLGIPGHDDTPAKPAIKITPMFEPANQAVAQHEAKLAGIDVGHSDLIDHIDAVDEIKPGEYQQLNPKSQQKVKDILDHLEGLGDSKPGLSKNAAKIKDQLGVPHNHAGQAQADAFHEPIGIPGAPGASAAPGGIPTDGTWKGHAPHVKEAIDYANGFKAGTNTKKLAAYDKLSHDEMAALDPNTQKLMAANLAGMQKKFLDPKKKNTAGNALAALQVAQGGGAGAGGSSAVHTPTVGALDHEAKASQGAANALKMGVITKGPGDGSGGYEALQQVLAGMHASPDQAKVSDVFSQMGSAHADKLLEKVGVTKGDGIGGNAHPLLAKEITDALKGGEFSSKKSPLTTSLVNSNPGDVGPLVNAVLDHPHLGPDALGVKMATPVNPAETAHALSLHAANVEHKPMIPGFEKLHGDVLNNIGQEAHHSGLAQSFATTKTMKTLASLDLGPDLGSKVKSKLHAELGSMGVDYKQALDENNPAPGGLAGKVDGIVADVNAKGEALAKQNGWSKDSDAIKSWKAAYFETKVKEALSGNPGAGGSTSHSTPASVPAPSVPNVTPAVPHSAPTSTPSATTKTAKGTILLKHAQALKVVSLMKSFPEGQYLESPEPKIWDNLVAISAHEGVTPMQALTTLDDQNAKKLGLTNTNLLEKKVRAWLATADGKAYADANKTPKATLLDHIKEKDASHADFTNKTGIDLPPGEKVQKLGGPGEHDENKPVADFGKHDVATAEKDQNKLKSDLGVKFTPQQLGALTEYVNGSGSINGWLRDEHTPSQKSIDNAIYLQSMMLPTPRDHLLLRGTGWTQFPPEARSYEGLQKLVGETLEEPAFLSASVSKSSSGFGGAVKMHIQAPKGTMGVFTKDNQYHSQFLGSEAELLLAAKTELKVLKVWKEGGQVQVLMRVVS